MASVIVVVIIFVLLRWRSCSFCQNGGWQGAAAATVPIATANAPKRKRSRRNNSCLPLRGRRPGISLPFCKGSFFLALLLHKCTKTGILINKYNFREALPMKADKYRFDAPAPVTCGALLRRQRGCNGQRRNSGQNCEKLQKMAALEAER